MHHLHFHLRLSLILSIIGILYACGPGDHQVRNRMAGKRTSPGDTLLTKARQAFEKQHYGSALSLVDSAVHIQPEDPEILMVRGKILEALNRSSEARRMFAGVLSLDSTYRSARYSLGNLDFQQGRFRSALRWYRGEIRHHPQPQVWLNVGLVYANLHRADSARAAYRRAMALDSTFAPAYMLLGQEFKNDGRMRLALRTSLKGLALEPNNPSSLGIVGSMQFQQGQLDQAEANLKKAIELRSWDYRAHYTLGRIFEQRGDQAEAGYHLGLADSLQAILTTAAHLERQVQENPYSLQRWIQLVELYRSMERYHEALAALQAAAVLEPSDIAIQNNLAYLFLATGDTSQAIVRLRSIVRQDSLHEETWRNLGTLYLETGNPGDALYAWRKVAVLTPGDPVAQGYLDSLTVVVQGR